MNRKDISTEFYGLVAPSYPNEWEVEEIVESLVVLSDGECRGILKHIPAIWPISHSLCYRYVQYGASQVGKITVNLLDEWVRQLLFHYENEGLRGAEAFMADVEANFLAKLQGDSAAALSEVNAAMTHYIRGVSGQYLSIGEDDKVWTDTGTIYLPSKLEIFNSRDQNILFYKFLVTHQWALIYLGAFSMFVSSSEVECEDEATVRQLEKLLGEQDRTLLIFKVYLFIKTCTFIRQTLPGLWSRCRDLLYGLMVRESNLLPRGLVEQMADLKRGGEDNSFIVSAWDALSFIKEYENEDFGLLTQSQIIALGELRFDRASQLISIGREKDKQDFIKMVAGLIPAKKENPDREPVAPAENIEAADGAAAMMSKSLEQLVQQNQKNILQINNQNVTVPDELVALAEKIMNDIGGIPDGYVQAASGLARGGVIKGDLIGPDGPGSSPGRDEFIYDEWDCRRNGYRRDWCKVSYEELAYSKSNFIERTLAKHGGLRKRLLTQFELMRSADRRVRRQRDGDELDLEAIIDALGDVKAGQAGSDRLFVRLERDERSITTLFLIDMSNSTSGWIGTLIKEALVLLCEALEKVGDEYGIYGFSGMKRSKCRIYPVKHLEEPYDQTTMERVASIGPKEYTRMAPAIRHLTSILEKSPSKTRLLITLSDGKPEDYDHYNGEYAIEDTKKALQEARGKGITPFCVTIDKRAHDYLDHMFGAGNYIFINKIESLPLKMANIYRLLTR